MNHRGRGDQGGWHLTGATRSAIRKVAHSFFVWLKRAPACASPIGSDAVDMLASGSARAADAQLWREATSRLISIPWVLYLLCGFERTRPLTIITRLAIIENAREQRNRYEKTSMKALNHAKPIGPTSQRTKMTAERSLNVSRKMPS